MDQDITGTRQDRDKNPIPPLFIRCEGCPYKSHGFVCWNGDGSCMKTWMAKNRKKKKGADGHEKSNDIPAE